MDHKTHRKVSIASEIKTAAATNFIHKRLINDVGKRGLEVTDSVDVVVPKIKFIKNNAKEIMDQMEYRFGKVFGHLFNVGAYDISVEECKITLCFHKNEGEVDHIFSIGVSNLRIPSSDYIPKLKEIRNKAQEVIIASLNKYNQSFGGEATIKACNFKIKRVA